MGRAKDGGRRGDNWREQPGGANVTDPEGDAARARRRVPPRARVLAPVALLLALISLPACQSKTLLLITVDRGKDLDETVSIAALEARTSLTGLSRPGRQVNTAGDASTTQFPLTFGLYEKPHVGLIIVGMVAYSSDLRVVAVGTEDITVDDREEQQFSSPPLLLHPCPALATNNKDLCELPDASVDMPDVVGDADRDASVTDADADGGPSDSAGDMSLSDADSGFDERPDAPAEENDGPEDRPDVPPDIVETETSPDLIDVAEGGEGGDGGDGGDAIAAQDADGGTDTTSVACDNYCRSVVPACPTLYANETQCRRVCSLSELDGQLDLACRAQQALLAVCNQASVVSDHCDPAPCIVFCTLGTAICGDQFPQLGDCFVSCIGEDVGDIGNASAGETLACRLNLLQGAIENPGLCASAIPGSTTGPCQAQP